VEKRQDSSKAVADLVGTNSTHDLVSEVAVKPSDVQCGADGGAENTATRAPEPAPIPQVREKVSFSMGFKMKK
jgi:hypothetical protein